MEDVIWGQPPNSIPEGAIAQQATQLYQGSTAQVSQAEEPAETSADQAAESESDPEVSTAWMSDLVQELVNTQESDSAGFRYCSVLCN